MCCGYVLDPYIYYIRLWNIENWSLEPNQTCPAKNVVVYYCVIAQWKYVVNNYCLFLRLLFKVT